MISVSKLFEVAKPATYAPPAQSPVAEPRNYVRERLASLRKMIGKSGTNLKDLQQQIKDYQQTNRFNNKMGVTQY